MNAEDPELLTGSEEQTNEIWEEYESYCLKPININTATADELLRIPCLNEDDVEKILAVRHKNNFSTENDLHKSGLSSELIRCLKNYIYFSSKTRIKASSSLRTGLKDGQTGLSYQQKTLLNYRNFTVGFISQQDAGEKNLLDHHSQFLVYEGNSFIRKLILGNYRISSGEGIVFSRKPGFARKSISATISETDIQPYTSTYEIWDLRGAAAKISLKNFCLTAFYSNNDLDVRLDDQGKITSFNESGLHPENGDQTQTRETILGADLSYTGNNFHTGLLLGHFEFANPFSDPVMAQKYWIGSLHSQTVLPYLILRSEIALTDKKVSGFSSLSWKTKELNNRLYYRSYQPNFPTWHGSPFSCNSNFENQHGFYYELTWRINKNFNLKFYADIWNHPDRRYYEKMPTTGSEIYLQSTFRLKDEKFIITFQSTSKEKYLVLTEGKIRDFTRNTAKLIWQRNLGMLTSKTGLIFSTEYLPEEEIHDKGFLFFQKFQIRFNHLDLLSCLTCFHTDIPLYSYDDNVLGAGRSRLFQGDGIYLSVVGKIKIAHGFDFQIKYGDEITAAGGYEIFILLNWKNYS